MPLSSSISLTPDVQNPINSAASQYSVDSLVLSAIAQCISGGNQFNSDGSLVVNNFGGAGVPGIALRTAHTLASDATTLAGNIRAGAAEPGALLGEVDGHLSVAVSAYFAGSALVLSSNGIPPV